MMYQRGFTLIEMILALTLGMALVILASGVYSNLQRIATRSLDMQNDWLTQNFIRQQIEAADMELNRKFKAIVAEPDSFSFISRYSAQFGQQHRPVFVTYRYDASAKTLWYREITIPPEWMKADADPRQQLQLWRRGNWAGSYENFLWRNIDGWKIEYWQVANKNWSEQWSQENFMPGLMRWRWQQAGRARGLAMGGGVLSLSFASGS